MESATTGAFPPPPFYRGPVAVPSSSDLGSSYDTIPMSAPAPQPVKARADGRKKFTAEQTAQMEMLFKENTHPSREQRTQLADAFDVNEKSVGIWFQNRRQAVRRERKAAAEASQSGARLPPSGTGRYITAASTGRALAHATIASASNPASGRPTLESVASDHQLPNSKARSVFNASYHPDHTPHIWGHMMSSPSPPPHDEGREREREREGSPYSGPPSSPRHRSSSTIQLEAAPPHSQSYYSHPSSRSYPYSRPKIASPKSRPVYRSGNASSDVESDSQRSTSTRDDPHAMYEFERSQRTRAGSSSLLYSRSHSSYPGPGPSRSRTRSVSPSRRPHLSSGIGGGPRSHLGPNPYPPHGSQERGQAVGRTHSESTAIGMRSRGGSVGSPGSSSRVTLEWACANANKLPSSPLKPHEGEITDECEDRDIKPSVDDGDGHGYRDGPEYDVPTVRSRRRGSSSARYELNITRPGGIPTDRDGKDSVLKHLPPFHHSRSHQSSHRLDPQEDEVDELELTETEAELDGDVGGGADGRTDASLSLMSMSTMDDTTEALTPFDGRSLNSSSSSPGIRLGSMSRESSFGQSWPGPGAENGTVRGKSSSGASSRVLHSGLSALMDASSLVRHPADHKPQQSRDSVMRKAASGPVGSARDNERDRNDAWLAQSSGRTVRNPNAPASHSHLVHHPSSYSRSHSHSAARSSRSHSSRSLGRGVATPAPVSREVIAAAATDNSQQEIDAALALVGLFSAQPPESSVHEVKTEDSKDN